MTFQTFLRCASALVPATLAATPAVAQQQTADIATDVIVVTASPKPDETTDIIDAPRQIALPADAVAIAARAPGAAAVGNGALSGQLSYRGLFGERVTGTINGQRFATGGPNAMDPPMHYAPSILVESIAIARGVSPVSDGPALAGAIDAQLLQAHFAGGSGVEVHGQAAAQYRSVDESHAAGGLLALATSTVRLGVIASREEGSDYRFAGGRAGGTSFERTLYGVHGGIRLGQGELFAEYRRSETDPSGNPPFALDIVYFNTNFFQAGWRGDLADNVGLQVRLGRVTVGHLMDNQTLRRPVAAVPRASFAQADTTTADASLRIGSAGRHILLGGDAEWIDKTVVITNPANAAFSITAQPLSQGDRAGGFIQWRHGSGQVEWELGARLDRTRQRVATPVLGTAVTGGPVTLANAFAASARRAGDTTVDAALRIWLPGDEVTPRLNLARKTRVPSLLERFAWLPTEASYGLADGNIYVGNQALRPEVAWIAEAGFDLDSGPVTMRPTLFYRRIDHYIQGTAFDASPGVINSPVEMVASMNGDATPLMFRNTDAQLYGLDFDFSARLTDHLQVDGTSSWVRGKRRDTVDNLYRVPPLSLRLAALWQAERWTLGAEMTAADNQRMVSATNGETPSDGYAVFGLFASYALSSAIRLEAGVENLFDAFYQPHLAGLNRVGVSDVPLGQRLPGAGRGLWARASASF
ncbi:TonB-dependent receptor plug domain-containing protein [Alteraurantiacibacter buctensis]|uniref:TonB-dependent receptor n=1 Tax=Alteraurantiacibacter buctensis TaxID=1503981 RepID=A0A844YVL4_9SPHN|nr:TonB-dependent receptor [Alteraurantiacibacter buctensis]MXO71579.1 TonB-dependent receptor [Alteraurantiacibacter buctensis]